MLQTFVQIPANPRAAIETHSMPATIHGIEISGTDSELLNSDLSQALNRHRACPHIGENCAATALYVRSFATGHLAVQDAGAREEAWALLQGIIDVAATIGASRISIAPAVVDASRPDRVDYQSALNRTFDGLERLCPFAQQRGVQICVRAAQHGFLMSAPEMRELMDALASPIVGTDLDDRHRCDRAAWHDWVQALAAFPMTIGVAAANPDDAAIVRDQIESAPYHAPDTVLVLRSD